jgi:integrase
MPLSDTKLRSLKAKDKPYKVADGDGLFAQVAASGSVLWRWKYRFDGREKLLALGRYPEVGLAAARERRNEARRILAAGRDPSDEKQRQERERIAAGSVTFEVIVTELIDKKQQEGKAPATIAGMQKRLAHAKPLMPRPISDITPVEILTVLRAVEKRGHHETAHKLRGIIGEACRYAIATGRATSDPTRDLRGALINVPARPRDAIVDPEGFGALMRAVASHANTVVRSALEILALTATRPGEVRCAQWNEINWEKREWRIPARRMKMRRDHVVPLSDAALILFRELRALADDVCCDNDLVFPGARKGRPLSENTLNAALATLGFGGGKHTAHGFRSSFSTMTNESGKWSVDAIEKALAHEDGSSIRGRYARHELLDERRDMMNWWAERIEIMRRGATVIPLPAPVERSKK